MGFVPRLLHISLIPLVVLGLSKVHSTRMAPNPYDFTEPSRIGWVLGFVVLLWISGYTAGLPTLVRSWREALIASVSSVTVAVAAISAVQLLLGDALLPRFVVFGSALALIPLMALCGVLGGRSNHRAAQRDRVLFVGGPGEASQLQEDINLAPERPAVLLASVEVEETLPDGQRSPLVELVEELQANVLVLDLAAQAEPTVVAQAATVHQAGVRVRTLSLFYEEWLGKLPLSELERISLLFDIGEVHRARYARVKRLFDVFAGALSGILCLIVIPFILIGNSIANKGPLFFRQERVGKGGVPFTILKFRTMRVHVGPAEWTAANDSRVTLFGRVLRISHLDELPQALNILRGDLSLVGPRPEQTRYVEELSEKLPFYKVRHLVRPGLTGWAQVKYGYAADERDALQKLQYEFFYLRRQGLILDSRIVARTLQHLAAGGGR